MRNLGTALVAALASLLLATPTTCAKPNQPPGKGAILLSNVQALTLRTNRMTTSRRVSAAPQLKCIGHEKICKLYEIETMRCKNEGYDYDEEDIQWTCTAPLPSEFKLGSTDVICEGYRNSDDPWVLKGSCGVEYRMLLTDEVVVTVLLDRRVKDGGLVFGLVLGLAGRRDIRWDGIVPVARVSEIHLGSVILEKGVRDIQRRRNSRRLRRGQDLDRLGADRWSGW
ncbi:unnamed protein product [Penicillium pancosmium]